MNDNVIDIRDKEKDKVIEGYAIAASETQIQNAIWEQTKSLDKALSLYKKLKLESKKENKESNSDK